MASDAGSRIGDGRNDAPTWNDIAHPTNRGRQSFYTAGCKDYLYALRIVPSGSQHRAVWTDDDGADGHILGGQRPPGFFEGKAHPFEVLRICRCHGSMIVSKGT